MICNGKSVLEAKCFILQIDLIKMRQYNFDVLRQKAAFHENVLRGNLPCAVLILVLFSDVQTRMLFLVVA